MNILQLADELIHGERVQTYGSPSQSFSAIATIASILCDKDITPDDVCKILVVQKLVRDTTSPENLDHLTDACGYLGIAADLRQEENFINELTDELR
jgi:hypothetical protein